MKNLEFSHSTVQTTTSSVCFHFTPLLDKDNHSPEWPLTTQLRLTLGLRPFCLLPKRWDNRHAHHARLILPVCMPSIPLLSPWHISVHSERAEQINFMDQCVYPREHNGPEAGRGPWKAVDKGVFHELSGGTLLILKRLRCKHLLKLGYKVLVKELKTIFGH